ncbi:MAG: glycosyltransferase, partial [Bacteroidota bacterium]
MTGQNPKISVILPAYKGSRKLLHRSIDSILNQTFSDLELIIVLDNPENNNLIDFFREFEEKDKRVRFYVNEGNLGIAGTVNRGIKAALGEFIAR